MPRSMSCRARESRQSAACRRIRSVDTPTAGGKSTRLDAVGNFAITMPAVSYARELWRFGEADLAQRAAAMSPGQCADVGERAGDLSMSGEAERLWPDGPRGHASAVLLAAVEYLEGRARPCARVHRLPEKSLPEEWKLSEEERWGAIEPVTREMNSRMHGRQ